MTSHDLWHTALLLTTLLGGGGLVLLALVPMLFDETPAGLVRARPWILVTAGVAVALIVQEWRGVH